VNSGFAAPGTAPHGAANTVGNSRTDAAAIACTAASSATLAPGYLLRHAALSCTASSDRNSQHMAQTRIIKKYPNRRLYDTDISSYITLEDVRQLIVDNEPFEVRDAKTSEDITRSVLLQIIADQEQDGQPILSTELLSQIIRFYGDSLQGFMGSYLERSMQTFLE